MKLRLDMNKIARGLRAERKRRHKLKEQEDAFVLLASRPGIDHFRRRGAADRAYEAFARELATRDLPSAEMEAEILRVRVAAGLHAEAGVRRGP